MRTRPVIAGAGGKGGGGGQELPDSIRSTQIADVLDLLGEGEVEGLTFGLRSIYLDGVPLQNADDSFNFEGVQVQFTPGTQGQAAIAGADGVLNTIAVQVDVPAATPVVRTISNAAVDTVRVTIEVPQLTRQDAGSGDLVGSSFEWAVDLQSNGGGFVQVFTDVVEGKTGSRYSRSKEFALTGSAPWDIRVRRVSPDSTTQLEVNAFRWSSYTEVQSLKLRYPNSALVRLRVGAQQFSRIPVRAYDLMGLRVRVPTNYNTRTKTYTGVWDGTFKVDWTDCPAWIYYDAVTSNRYGLGRYFDSGAGLKWAMYEIGRYCDVMVPDGRGGMEPRFRCGLNLETREQAYKVLSDLAAIFRGMAYWAGMGLQVVQDAPGDPVAAFTNSNVEGSKFTYTGASYNKRPSQVVVWFNDLQDFGRLTSEVVVDPVLQRQRGIRSVTLSPLGIWSRGQAHRLGRWVLYSERLEGQGVSFSVGLDGKLPAPGKLFTIADANEAGERTGGRVRSATTTAVTLDAAVQLQAGQAYTLTVMLQDPADPARLVPQKRPVTNAAGQHQTLNVFPAFTSAPFAETVWVLESPALQATVWRCMGVSEREGQPGYDIVGLRHYPEKYALIEQGIEFDEPPVSRIRRTPLTPASIEFTETVYALGQERRSKVTLSWPEPEPGLSFLVAWRLAGGPWVDMPATSENCVEIDALAPGLLDASVKSRNAIGLVSAPVTDTFTVTGNQVQVGANLIDPSWWRPGVALEWQPGDNPAGESAIVWGQGPRGSIQALWQATAMGAPATGAAGGWWGGDPNGAAYPKNTARIDPQRTYRFSFPVKRLSGGGVLAIGLNATPTPDLRRVCFLNTTTSVDGPFFWSGDLPQSGKWYLVVGFVFPAGSTGVVGDVGGLFDMATNERVASVTNFCWMAGARNVKTQAFQFNAATGSQVQWAPPSVELVDGTDGSWLVGPRGASGASSITLVPSGGCETPGPDRIRKASGVSAWDSDCRSLESFVGGAWVSWQCERADRNLMVGLNSDPAAAADYQNIDCAWFCSAGLAHIFESGNFVLTFGAYTTADVFTVLYDGRRVRYLVNGTVVREVSAAAGQRFYLDSSFQEVGAEVKNVRFGPVGTAGQDGAAGANAQLLTLLASAQAFTFNGAGVASPAGQVITLTALLANLPGTATFTATGYDAAGTSLGALTLGGTGNSRTLAVAAFGAAQRAVVQASSGAFSDQVTIVRLRDGAAGSNGQNSISGYLTNEAHTVATAPDGSGGNYGTAGGDFKVFDGLTEINSGVAFSVVAGSVSGILGLAIGGDGVYSLTGMNADTGTATLRAVYGPVTIDRVYTISRSKSGPPTPWIRVTGDNLNANGNGFSGRGVLLQAGYSYAVASRGHTAVAINPATSTVVGSPQHFDTYTAGTAGLRAWLGGVPAGRIVALYSFDASACDAALRADLAQFGSGSDATWVPDRVSHVFIGMRGFAPGQAYEAVSSATDSAGVVQQQAYYSDSGLVRNGADGASGTSVFLATVYRQQAGSPSLPTGGSFNFSTAVLTPPAGWSVTRPAPGLDETFSVQQVFSTTTPGATVAGGAWSGLASIAPGSAGPVTSPGNFFAFGYALSPTDAFAEVTFKRDGSIWVASNLAAAYKAASYILPNASTAGDTYEVRADLVSSTGATGGASGAAAATWHQLNLDRTFRLVSNENAFIERVRTYSYTVRRIATGETVSSGQFTLENAVEL